MRFGISFGCLFNVVFGNVFPSGANFTTDSVSGKAAPNSTAEWTSFLTSISSALAAPQHLYLLQEASGVAVDSIGASNLTASNVAYQKSISGWSRKAIGGASQIAGTLTNTTILDTAANSFLLFCYLRFDAATLATRGLVTFGVPLLQIPGAQIRLREGASLASTVNNHDITVHPIVMAFNNANQTIKLYSDLEKLSVTWSASSGTAFTLTVSAAADPGLSDFLYSAMWTGSAAETTDAEVKKLITGLGFSPSWT